MDKSVILNIVLIVLCAALYGLRLYFKTKGSVFEAASQFIAEIENSGLVGPEKMAYVVSQLFALIPIPLKSIFTESRLQEIAQEVFDTMKEYALKYAKRVDEEAQAEENTEPKAEEPKPAEGDAE